MAKSKYSYNPNPRLSANQLAEILNASPTRRKSIIAAAKFPSTAIVAKYRDASSLLGAFLCNPARAAPNFVVHIEGLEAKSADPSLSQWVRDDAAASAEALSKVQSAYNATGLGKLDLKSLPANQPRVVIEGVEVSASAACSVHGQFKGNSAVGAMSIFFNKSEASQNARIERCKSVAVLLLIYAEQHLSQHGVPLARLCMSYDVFAGKVVAAPNAYKSRLENMRFSCEEVALRWPTIQPPADYDGPDLT